MNPFESSASFTPDQLQFIGQLAVIGFVPFITFVIVVVKWYAKVNYHLNNFGKLLNTKTAQIREQEEEKKRRRK
jgi:uncharacterized transporter YbjL